MTHLTFVHGIGNKPPADALIAQWKVALVDDGGPDLDALGVTTSVGRWSDVLYGAPARDEAAQESSPLELVEAVTPQDADLGWLDDVPAAEQAFVARLAARVGLASLPGAVVPGGADDVPSGRLPGGVPDPGPATVPGSALELVPLPAWLTRRLIRVFLRDVHHYLYDAASEPRPGERFRVRRDVRARVLAALAEGAANPGPHVVVCHSLGTVVVYDVLTSLPAAPRVDALVTLGSPLGIREVQEALTPPWTARDGWPADRLGDGSWVNVSDRLDPVCGPDPRIGNEYRAAGTVRVQDVLVRNPGSWRHSVTTYLGRPQVRAAVVAALGVQR